MRSEVTTRWVGTWACSPQLIAPSDLPPGPGLVGNTLRQKVFATLEGSRVRVSLSNEAGEATLTLGSAHLATCAGASAIDPGSDRALLFDGRRWVTIGAGQRQWSDPLDFEVTALSSLALSLHFERVPSRVTGHPGSRTTSYLQRGAAASSPSLLEAATTDHWYFITGIDVEADTPSAAIVTLGDSLTDGRGSSTNGNNRWPDNLARRLKGHPATARVAVLNHGMGGNAVVRGGLGPAAAMRFERDVLDQSGVRWVIVLEGVNDIGANDDDQVVELLIEAYQGFIDSAHARELLVYGVPLFPFGGSSYGTPQREAARQSVNQWIRTSQCFDAVIDLEATLADPKNPGQLLAAYDCGDHLHLSARGYEAMADAIDLGLFQL